MTLCASVLLSMGGFVLAVAWLALGSWVVDRVARKRRDDLWVLVWALWVGLPLAALFGWLAAVRGF